jgi:hypothetical protein
VATVAAALGQHQKRRHFEEFSVSRHQRAPSHSQPHVRPDGGVDPSAHRFDFQDEQSAQTGQRRQQEVDQVVQRRMGERRQHRRHGLFSRERHHQRGNRGEREPIVDLEYQFKSKAQGSTRGGKMSLKSSLNFVSSLQGRLFRLTST